MPHIRGCRRSVMYLPDLHRTAALRCCTVLRAPRGMALIHTTKCAVPRVASPRTKTTRQGNHPFSATTHPAYRHF